MYCFLWIILRFPSVGTFSLHFNRKQRHPLIFNVSEADAWGCQRRAIWLVSKGRSPEGVRRTTVDLTSLSTNMTFLKKQFQPGRISFHTGLGAQLSKIVLSSSL
jgi:hypothetical protein